MSEYRTRTALPLSLRLDQAKIEKIAKEAGLDFFPIVYEMLTFEQMSEIAAKSGFSERYPHWSFGMQYEELSKSYEYGLSKIYEMIINSNPSTAYLLEGNSTVIQRLVMAHCAGHCDFFKNNFTFRATDLDGGQTTNPQARSKDYNPKRNWIDRMANNGARIRKIVDTMGLDKVEEFLDTCLSVENLIDIHAPFSGKRQAPTEKEAAKAKKVPRLKAKEYMEDFINPEAFINDQKKKLETEQAKAKKFPEYEERDVIGFLLNNAPLETWERSILEVIYDEAYYFSPQRQTKIMNEGWASFHHSELMITKILDSSEIIEFAEINAGVLATSGKSLNPYKLGVELYRNIEERWNKGQYGREWEECTDAAEKANWNTHAGLGRKKIFEVRALYNDATFIDEFLTQDFIREQKMFSIGWSNRNERYEVETREFQKVKDKLLFQLTNSGNPFISVEDANYDNRGELLLKHDHNGMDLRQDYAKEVLKSMVRIWKRPCNIGTKVEDKSVLL